MKRLILSGCLLLVGSCLLGGCGSIKRVELGKPHDPPILEVAGPGLSITVRALTVNIVREEGEVDDGS